MTDLNSKTKTPSYKKEAIKKFKIKHEAKKLSIDVYLVNSDEAKLYEKWKNIKNKKKLFLEFLANYEEKNS